MTRDIHRLFSFSQTCYIKFSWFGLGKRPIFKPNNLQVWMDDL